MRKHKSIEYPLEYVVSLFLGKELVKDVNFDYRKKFDKLIKKINFKLNDKECIYNNCFFLDLEMLDYTNQVYNVLALQKEIKKTENEYVLINNYFEILWVNKYKHNLEKITDMRKIEKTKLELIYFLINDIKETSNYNIIEKDDNKEKILDIAYYYWNILRDNELGLKNSSENEKIINKIKSFSVDYLKKKNEEREDVAISEGKNIKKRIYEYLNLENYDSLENLDKIIEKRIYLENNKSKENYEIFKQLSESNIKINKDYNVIKSMFKIQGVNYDFILDVNKHYNYDIIDILNIYYINKKSRNKTEIIDKLPYLITIKLLIDKITENNNYHKNYRKNVKLQYEEKNIKELKKKIESERQNCNILKHKLIGEKETIKNIREKEDKKILELTRRLEEKDKIINNKDKLLKNCENDIQSLKKELLLEIEWEHNEKDIILSDIVIPEKNVTIIGGHLKWQNKLKKRLPDSYSFIEATTTQNIIASIQYSDWVFYNTRHLSHQLYEMTKEYCKSHGINIGYIKYDNLDRAIVYIVKKINSDKTVLKNAIKLLI